MDPSVPQCCKNVWVLLTGTSLLKSKEYIGSILETNAPKLVNGILYYTPCKVKDVNEVKQILTAKQIDEVSPEFLYKLATLLDIEPLQAFELFLSFLLHEYKGTPKSIKNYFNSEKSVQILLNSLWEYYYSERLFALFSMKQILSNWQQSSVHPYQQLFRDFLTSEKVKNEVLKQLLAQFKSSISMQFPNRSSSTEGMYDKWLEITVKEQLELLQLLILYLNEVEPTMDNILELMDLFRAHGFGARPLFDRTLHISKNLKVESYLKFIGFLESTLVVECFRLDSLSKCMEEESNEHCLLKNPEKLKKLDNMIQSLPMSTHPCSLIFFAWTFVRSWELPELVSSQALIKHFGSTALNLKVFDYAQQSLRCNFFENLKGTVVEGVLKLVLTNLFSSVFSLFGLAMAEGSLNALYEVGKYIMDDEVVSELILDSGLDNGMQLLLKKSADEFPQNIKHFLELCISLIQPKSYNGVISELSNMSTFCEWIDSNEVNLLPTEDPSIYVLAADRYLYNDRKLVIRQNTPAKLLKHKDNRSFFIQWNNVSLNCLTVLAHVFDERLQLTKKGYFNTLKAEAIEELCLITDLVAKLLDFDPDSYREVSGIVEYCFDGFRLFTRFPQIPRKLIVSFLELFSLLSANDQHSEAIWDMIIERGFFPYMIGLKKDKEAIISGQDTNASKIGEIIAFEECVVGEYQLCCAYLKFLCNTCSTKKGPLLPALIHVITEIFPSFNRWYYKKNKDLENIGHLCLELFQKVLCLNAEDKDWKDLVDVCKTSLLNNAAGETLLQLIISGETVAKEIIETLGSDIALVEHHLIVMIRQSLSVLNRLLCLQEKEKTEKFVASAVEQSLFSTNTSKPNMILVLSHYVFQNYDSRLATLAATLMKRLSKHFPMSLLACLGSEAEAVKDHFLFKLEAVTEDLRLKVSLLDFLSSCIKHQPGLIEMFLNIDAGDEPDTETSSCLKTVLEMLEEKMTEKYFCPKELHCAAVKFLYTFWLQSHLLAINSLKKTKNLWQLICFPFLKENGTFSDKVCGYIWRILAREVFFVKVLERGEFKPSFVEIFDGLKKNDCLTKMSRQIFACCSNQEADDTDADAGFLLASWRDFLLSFSKFSPFEVSDETKQAIVADIVTSLSIQLNFKEKPNHTLLLHLSDILLLLLTKWDKTAIRSVEDWIKIKTEILYATNEQKELLTIGFHTTINILMCQTFKMCSKSESWIRENLKDCFLPWCGLFKYSLRILDKQMTSGKCDNELKLTMTALTSFQHLFSTLPDVMVLSPTLRNNLIIESFCTVLCTLIRQNVGSRLAESIISIFVELSTNAPMADLLQLTKVLEDISTALQNSYKSIKSVSSYCDFSWLKLFTMTLKLATSLLITLRHHYAEVAVSFVITHFHVIERCLTEIRQNPSVDAVNIVNDIMTFLCVLVDLRIVWITKHKNSYEKLLTDVSKTCNSVISFLIRPNLLHYVLTHPSSTRNLTAVSASQLSLTFPSRNVSSEEESNKLLKRSVSLENEPQNELNPDVQQSFLRLLSYALQFLHSVNPSLVDVLDSIRAGEATKLQLHPSFSTPNIDPDNVTSFGSLLYCLSFAVRFIQKIEKESSTGEVSNEVNVMKNRLPFILETSLSLVVTNAILAQNCQSLKERERQMIRRELKNELNSILISRQPKRNLSGSNIAAAPRSPVNTLLDRPFVKQLLEIIEKD